MKKLIYLIKSDLYRYTGKISFRSFISTYLKQRGLKLSFYYRICKYFYDKKTNILNKFGYMFFNLFFKHYKEKYCVDFSLDNEIDSGLYIGHGFSFIIGQNVKIGKNLNIVNNVTIGRAVRLGGSPIIGDNVFIGTGAVIFGKINIGSNVAIGANAVVTKDIPDNSVVGGVPAKIISEAGAMGCLRNIDYEKVLG